MSTKVAKQTPSADEPSATHMAIAIELMRLAGYKEVVRAALENARVILNRLERMTVSK